MWQEGVSNPGSLALVSEALPAALPAALRVLEGLQIRTTLYFNTSCETSCVILKKSLRQSVIKGPGAVFIR